MKIVSENMHISVHPSCNGSGPSCKSKRSHHLFIDIVNVGFTVAFSEKALRNATVLALQSLTAPVGFFSKRNSVYKTWFW
jgi:hypothetical protein